jgi:cell division initiation protein
LSPEIHFNDHQRLTLEKGSNMGLTALEVQQQSFGTSRHGYDPQEVDVFLERVAVEVDNFNRALLEAKSRFDKADERARVAEAKLASAAREASSSSGRDKVTEDQISKAFIAAQRSADALREEARKEADKTYHEAEERARDIVRDAAAERQRVLAEIDRLRESCEKFRTEYLSLLNHFSTDAQKTLPSIDAMMPETAASKARDAQEAREYIADNSASFAPPAAPSARAASSGDAYVSAAIQQPPNSPVGGYEDYDDGMDDTDQMASYAPSLQQDRAASRHISANDYDDDIDIEEID